MSRSYCFTSFDENAPTFNEETIRYLVYQREKCPKTEKLHWQGYVEFYKTHRMVGASKLLGLEKKWLKVRSGTRIEARAYCMKEESRIKDSCKEFGIWLKGQGHRTDLDELVNEIENGINDYELMKKDVTRYERYFKFIDKCRKIINEKKNNEFIVNYSKNIELNDYQKKCMILLNEQNDREITWIHDEKGNKGKTVLSKYIVSKYKAQRFTNGKSRDIACAYNINNEYVCFDFARSCEDRINYQILEDIKNGMLFSSKYESKVLMFKEPKIIVFSNFLPDENKLSEDRWKIHSL